MSGRLPVAVVGAGPVGLAAALALARRGVDIVLLEKRPGLSAASKASTFHPPTLAILAALGLAVDTLGGEKVASVAFLDLDTGGRATLELDRLAGLTPFPFRLHLEQSELTPLLLAALQATGRATVRFDAELVSYDEQADKIALHLADGEKVNAALLIGADGAHSRVRGLAGMTFDGADYPDHVVRLFSRADMAALMPGVAPLTYLFRNGRSLSLLKMRDGWRTILRVPRDVPEARAVDPAYWGPQLEAVLPLARAALGLVVADWFPVSRRVASNYLAGRVLLMGDAAHLTNTRGGMNMNAGIHDAWALAGPVAAFWRDGDRQGLEAAAADRRSVAADRLIPRTDRSVSEPRWLDDVVALSADPAAARDYLARASMLDMVDAPSASAPGSAASAP